MLSGTHMDIGKGTGGALASYADAEDREAGLAVKKKQEP